jgi:hypothetical protein
MTIKHRFPKRKLDPDEAGPDEQGADPGQVGPDSGGQSGDTQGLSGTATVANESIEELATDDQALEASFADGVADAGNHPEQPVHTHERKESTI